MNKKMIKMLKISKIRELRKRRDKGKERRKRKVPYKINQMNQKRRISSIIMRPYRQKKIWEQPKDIKKILSHQH